MPHIIYAEIESLIKKIDQFANNSGNSSTKNRWAIPCGYSMPTIWAIDNIENKNILHRREDCMKKVFESLKEQAKNIIDFEKKKMQPLTKEELASHQDPKLYYICGKNISKKIF